MGSCKEGLQCGYEVGTACHLGGELVCLGLSEGYYRGRHSDVGGEGDVWVGG